MPVGDGDRGEAYCVSGGESCWEGGRRGKEGAGTGLSSSESSGVYCGLFGSGGEAAACELEALAPELPPIMPAIAAAGP